MSIGRFGFALARPILSSLDAERAHGLTINALKVMPPLRHVRHEDILRQTLFGLDFPSPVGLAAGFDKNAEVPNQMLSLGFGFVEVGTVTPMPQAGNPKPRLFRLTEDQAVINCMGFNNQGHMEALGRLTQLQKRGIIGVNIGANKDATDRVADYIAGLIAFGTVADYITVNVSSPNTPGLRGLQGKGELTELLSKLNETRRRMRLNVPMLLKIAPDLDDVALQDIASLVRGQVDGVIISNTTIARPDLRSVYAKETGGLSGKPLFEPSTRVLANFYQYTDGKIPLIGVGGISDVETAWAKICAGASLLQIYSALVYKGPALVAEISEGLARKLRESGAQKLADVVGKDAARYQSADGT